MSIGIFTICCIIYRLEKFVIEVVIWWYLNISVRVTLSRLTVVSSFVSNLSTHNDVMARTSPTWTHGAWTHAHATNQKSDGYAELTTMQNDSTKNCVLR